MKNFRIHPLFFIVCFVYIAIGKGEQLAASLTAVFLHEAGHAFSAKKRGYYLRNFCLMPFGMVAYANDGLPEQDGVFIALAGPLVNVFCALLIACLWWFFPAFYRIGKTFFYAHLTIGLFNLLPCYPMDGSRVVLGIVRKKQKWLSVMRFLGYFISFSFLVLFVASLFYEPAWQLPVLSATFFFGAKTQAEEEKYRLKIKSLPFLRSDGVWEEKSVVVFPSTKVGKILPYLSEEYLYTVRVRTGEKDVELKGEDIEKLFYCDRKKTIGDIMKSRRP